MSPAWIAPATMAAGAACLAYAAFLSPTRAAEQPPAGRQWAIKRCVADQCEIMAWRYSGPTACAVDISSERIAKQMPTSARLVCVQKRKEQ